MRLQVDRTGRRTSGRRQQSLLEPPLVAPDRVHLPPVGSQHHGDGATDPAAPSGHHRDPA
jgi:hypothetical protein